MISDDLAGRSVVPGFIDSDGDNAFAGGDLYKDTMVNGRVLPPVRGDSVPAMLNQVRALVREAAPGSPVYIRMADEFLNDLAKLTAADLDAIAPDNPLMLCLTTDSVVNTRMLELAFAAGLPATTSASSRTQTENRPASSSPPQAGSSGGTCATGPS